MGHTAIYYNLLDAFKQEQCPVCSLAERAVQGWLESVAYEMVNDPKMRSELRASDGFCNVHAYGWLEQRTLLGTAIIYNDVLTNLTKDLKRLRFNNRKDLLSGVTSLFNGGNDNESDGMLNPDSQCPVCGAQANSEREAIETLLSNLSEPEFGDAYVGSAGMCFPHLSLALARAPDERAFKALIEIATRTNEELCQQMRKIIRHHDYRYKDEPIGEEKGAATRALRHVVGEPGIRGLDLRSSER